MLKSKVTVAQGELQGKVEQCLHGTYVSFKGIPYAKPPTGALRFSAPQPPDNWTGIKNAFEHGEICMQNMFIVNLKNGSEDCLFLNVYTPNVGGKYPVMVFIHGGAFKNGSGNDDMYGPDFLVNQGVILVTINYRVDVLGFLCLDNEDVPGNVGLKDQTEAMKWIKDNITNFGGDSNNITIFGESAGAASVAFHLISPLSKGLFHAAIAQSGVCLSNWALDTDPVNRAFRLGNILGKTTTDENELVEFLRTVPVEELIDAAAKAQSEQEKLERQEVLFVPVIEKVSIPGSSFISKPINDLLDAGEFNDVPLIIGYNSGEGILFLNALLDRMDAINSDFKTFVSSVTKLNVNEEFTNKINQFYFDNKPLSKETAERLVHFRSDVMFIQSIQNFAKKYAAKSTCPVYFYVFDCKSELNNLDLLFGAGIKFDIACHGDDLFYIFKSSIFEPMSKAGSGADGDISPEAKKMASRLVALWTNFAKFKNPTPELNDITDVKWETMTADNMKFLLMTNTIKMRNDPHKERIDFLNKLYKQHGYKSKL